MRYTDFLERVSAFQRRSSGAGIDAEARRRLDHYEQTLDRADL